jgi:hypothetical protein
MVLDLADEQPEDKIYLIPARLEECDVPNRLARWQWVDLFDPKGYNRLLSAAWTAAERLDLPATTGELTALRGLQAGGLASPAGMPQPERTSPPLTPADVISTTEVGSAQDSELQAGPRFSRFSTEPMTSPQPGDSDAASWEEPQEPIPLNGLPMLRKYQSDLSTLLEEIDMRPDRLDLRANDFHERLVMPAYELMRTEVVQEHGSSWDTLHRRRFGDIYRTVASKWPAYREALGELEQARQRGMSINDAMMRLEGPRSGYITALMSFYDEFSDTLNFFFPP